MKAYLLFIFLFAYSLAFAALPDSVQSHIKNLEPKESAHYLQTYAYDIYPYNKDIALEAARKAIYIAEKHSIPEKLADALKVVGIIYSQYSEYDSSFIYYGRALAIAKKHNIKDVEVKLQMNIGINHFYLGEYEEALVRYHNCLEIYKKQNDTLAISDVLSNIGFCHSMMDEYERAVKYLKDAIPGYQNNKSKMQLARTYNALGGNYTYINKDSAVVFFEKGIELAGDESTTTKANLLINLAILYSEQGEKQKALEVYKNAYEIALDIENKTTQVNTLINIGKTYNDLEQYHDALNYLLKAGKLAEELGSFELQSSIAAKISFSYENLGDYKKALEYYQKYFALDDSIYNTSSNERILELDKKYETEKKEKQLAQKDLKLKEQNLEISKRNNQIILLISGLAVLILVAIILIIRQKQQKTKALAEKRKAEFQAELEGEEKERQRLGSELHDGLGQSLSAVRIMMSNLKEGKKDENDFDTAINQIDHTIQDLREISHKLMPATLLNHGLESALEELVQLANNTEKFNVTFDKHNVGIEIKGQLRFLIYRITQELLNNAMKYSNAQNISVQLMVEKANIQLIVEDDGDGFDLGNNSSGIGLNNIKRRVSLFNGTTYIDSHKGKGSSIIIHFNPLNA